MKGFSIAKKIKMTKIIEICKNTQTIYKDVVHDGFVGSFGEKSTP